MKQPVLSRGHYEILYIKEYTKQQYRKRLKVNCEVREKTNEMQQLDVYF